MNQIIRLFTITLLCACVVDLAVNSDAARIEAAKARAVDVAIELLEAENNAQGFGS